MHKKRERRIDRTFRLECTDCGGHRFAELGGDKREAAENGEDVNEIRCGFCRTYQRFEVVAP